MAIQLTDFLNSKPEPIPMLIGRGILPKRAKMIIGGQPKANKSFVALNIMLALARHTPSVFSAMYKSGAPVLPVTQASRVLYLEQELGPWRLQSRLANICAGTSTASLPMFIKSRDMKLRLDEPDRNELILEQIAECRPDVVVFDTFAKFHLKDENSAQEMGYVMRVLDNIIEDLNTSVILVHHLSKPNPDPDQQKRGGARLRGSSAIFGDVDTFMEVDRLSNEYVKEPILQISFELRSDEPLEPFYCKRLKSGEVVWMGEDFVWGGKDRLPRRASKWGNV